MWATRAVKQFIFYIETEIRIDGEGQQEGEDQEEQDPEDTEKPESSPQGDQQNQQKAKKKQNRIWYCGIVVSPVVVSSQVSLSTEPAVHAATKSYMATCISATLVTGKEQGATLVTGKEQEQGQEQKRKPNI